MDNGLSTEHIEPGRVPVRAFVHRPANGDTITATAVRITNDGVILQFEKACALKLGEEVICEIVLQNQQRKAVPSWGLGRVVHIENDRTALEFYAEVFD